MDAPTLINNIERIDRLHSLIRHDFRELGVKLPKEKKVKKQSRKSISLSSQTSQEGVTGNKIFGEPLSQIPSVFLAQYGYVPQFLLSTSDIVLNHTEVEGIFRKSGSVGRQKELRVAVEDGKPLDDANINDVTSLIKQFFRELPEPLICTIYQDAFLKCFHLPADKDPKEALMRMCLLLPVQHVGTLRYTMHMLHRVAQRSDCNKMTPNNLALVMAPNLLGCAAPGGKGNPQKMSSSEEKNLHAQTCIVELLIKHWEHVGMVPATLRQQLSMMYECFGTDDELDVSDDNVLDDSKDVLRKKKRRRSGSLTGIVSSIAQGFAKLRRSTDGKGMNMSTNSTFRAEMSMASDASMMSQGPDMSMSDITPHIVRKRRASGDNIPFSSNKKQAILGNLPQRSALGSTPFTPATLKKDQSSHKAGPSEVALNSTTPIMGTKTSRKKLNLFTSPGGNSKKMKRQTSVSGRLESPVKPGKGKNLLKKTAGSYKSHQGESSLAGESISDEPAYSLRRKSPKTTGSDSALDTIKSGRVLRSSSSTSLQESESSLIVVDGDDPVFDQIDADKRKEESKTAKMHVKTPGPRSKSVDSPGIPHSQPKIMGGGLRRQGRADMSGLRGKLDKSEISRPIQMKAPANPGSKECDRDSELRRSRRDTFEQHRRAEMTTRSQARSGERVIKPGQSGETASKSGDTPSSSPSGGDDLNKSQLSELDASLMEVVLPPPDGFGDQTMLEDDGDSMLRDQAEAEEEVNAGCDGQSEAGFSTISGGTVMRRTKSGQYACQDARTVSGTSICSSESGQSNFTFPPSEADKDLQEDTYVTLRPEAIRTDPSSEGDYVVLRHGKPKLSEETQSAVESSKGMKMLCENYHSSEEDSSSSSVNKSEANVSISKSEVNVSVINSHLEDLENMPTQTDVTRGKSLSAEDLQVRSRAQGISISRPHSLYLSPYRKVNYKPHLEISRETHKILSRAGYMMPRAPTDKSRDFQVPVRSPVRSAYREQMKNALRASFYERHKRLNLSIELRNKNRQSLNGSKLDETSTSAANTSISSEYEKLSLSNQVDVASGSGDTGNATKENTNLNKVISELTQKVTQLSEGIQAPAQHTMMDSALEQGGDVNTNCSDNFQSSEIKPSVQTKEDDPVLSNRKDTLEKSEKESTVPEQAKAKMLKEQDKAQTLSGFLDKELANQVQIKRAAVVFQKHDSILNVQQAGIVAQSVRQFSQTQSKAETALPLQKKGTASVRIPPVFSKMEEKQRHLKELAGFVKEKSNTEGFMNIPGTPATPKITNNAAEDHNEDGDNLETSESSDEGNVTVLEMNDENGAVDPAVNDNSDTSNMSSTSSILKAGNSQYVGTDPVRTPKKAGQQGLQAIKSPLLESTNTAPVATPRTAFNIQEALALCNPTTEVMSVATQFKSQNRPPTPMSQSRSRQPQSKRAKVSGSPLKRDEDDQQQSRLSVATRTDDDTNV